MIFMSSIYYYLYFFFYCSFCFSFFFFFFFNDTATTEIYTLSLHDALPICRASAFFSSSRTWSSRCGSPIAASCWNRDRKSTRLNSSHVSISYAVFCLKKKKINKKKLENIQDLINTEKQVLTRI